MKKPLKFALISGSSLIILFVAGLVTLFVMFPPEKIKDMAVVGLEEALGREISVESVSFSIFPAIGVSLSGVEVADTERETFTSQRPFIRFERFLISISVRSIFKGYPEITSVILDAPQIVIEVDEEGAFNFDDLKVLAEADTTGEVVEAEEPVMLPVPITLRRLSINRGELQYLDSKDDINVTIASLDQNVTLSIDNELRNIVSTGTLLLDDISVKTAEIPTPLSDLNFTFKHNLTLNLVEGTVDIEEIRLSLQKLYFTMSGTISDIEGDPELDLAINSEPFDIKDILAEIPVEILPDKAKLTASGTAQLNVAIKGVLKEEQPLPLKGNLTFNDGLIRYVDLPQSISNINSKINFTENTLEVLQTGFNFGTNPVELEVTIVDFERPQVDGFLKGKLDLSDVKDMMELPPGAALSGIVNADVSVKGEADPEDPSKLDLNGRVDLENLSIKWPPLLKPAVINGEFTLTSTAIGEKLSATIGRSSFDMEAEITDYLSLVLPDSEKEFNRPKIVFALNSPLLDVDELLPPQEGEPEESGEAGAPMIAPLPGIDMYGTVKAGKIIFDGLEMDDLNVDVTVVNDKADITMRTGFAGGRISNVLNADISNVENISFNNRLNVDQIQINDLMRGFGDFIEPTTALNRELKNIQEALYGSITVAANLSSSGGTPEQLTDNLSGNAEVKVTDGRISNALVLERMSGALERFIEIDDVNFRRLSASLRLDKGNMIFDDLQILSDYGDWAASGTVGLDTELDMKVSNRLSERASRSVLSVQNTGRDALKNLLSGTALSSATNILDDVGIPSDAQGRVTVKMDLGGNLSDPKVAFAGFGEGSAPAQQQQPRPSVRERATEQIQQTVDQKREQLEERLEREKRRAEEQVRQKAREQREAVEEQKQVIEEKRRDVEEDIRERGAEKLRRLF
ncbi:AsmA family protein [Chitinispirillales bacterium ANBcel5]|uniref:YhdP family protein n=1 Tax=Cellulosispirillum alkaliphilum TaxID=3039283 RepID=UPI002A50E711|nr:AsmA family protein [Chitinispirillales bacterium ANBcel5]